MNRFKLKDLAKTIRSKNAGVDNITFDIIFPDREIYEKVKNSKSITKKRISELYSVSEESVVTFVEFDPANAIKFTIKRDTPSGGIGERDVFGCQQYGPLLDVEVDVS